MKWKDKFTELTKKYKHAWVFLYILVYMPWFMFLEQHVTTEYHIDDLSERSGSPADGL